MNTTSLKKRLSEDEIGGVMEFVAIASESNGLTYKLDVHTLSPKPDDGTTYVLCRAKSHIGNYLVGFAAINEFGGEAEVTLISDDEAVFDAMYDAFVEATGCEKPIVTANKSDTRLIAWLNRREFVFSSMEYRMILDTSAFVRCERQRLMIRKAELSDEPVILELDRAGFGGAGEHALSDQDLFTTKIAYFDGNPVGKLRLEEHAGVFAIYGLSIMPQYRGRGFGRELLSTVISEIVPKDFKELYLEVASDNIVALNLYKSLGFQTKVKFEYYRPRKA